MKDLCLIYQKENKTLVKKLVSKLESDGISCWVSPRDFKQEEIDSLKTTVEESRIMVLILDKNSASNKEMIQALEQALEHQIEVIPFVLEKIESNLYADHFFYTFSWVAAYENSFEDSYEVLIDAYEDLSGEKKAMKKANISKKTKSKETISKPMIYAIVAIVLVIIAYFVYTGLSENGSSEIIVGKWKLSNYQDNLPRNHLDSINIIQTLQTMKANALLTFNDDHTFERRGFTPEPQIGKWELNPEKNILYLEPNGLNQKDQVNIEKLTENELIMVVNEVVEKNKVTTRISFSKLAN
jgi:hypothetical protein